MNKISILFALCALSTSANAQDVPLVGGGVSATFARVGIIGDSFRIFSRIIDGNTDCEYFDHQTGWEDIAGVTLAIGHGSHNWVYAKRSDVNKTIDWVYADHCPCGCPQTEKEARICSVCYREEQRTRTWGYNSVPRGESEYMKIKNR